MAASDNERDSTAVPEEQSAAASGGSGSSGDPPREIPSVVDTTAAPTLRSRIADLKKEQALARARNKELTKELRNKQRRNKRLKEKVGGLDDADLIDVLRMRDEKKRLKMTTSDETRSGASEPSSPALSRSGTQLGLSTRMGGTP